MIGRSMIGRSMIDGHMIDGHMIDRREARGARRDENASPSPAVGRGG